MATQTDDRSLGQMFAELSRETRTLIQQEIRLARTELAQKAAGLRNGAALILGGGLLAYGGLLAVVAAVVLVLVAVGMPAWAGALLGGILAAGAGYLFLRAGLDALRGQDERLRGRRPAAERVRRLTPSAARPSGEGPLQQRQQDDPD